MKILRFKVFENEGNTKSKSYSADQFDQFCDDVTKWCDENETRCLWCLFGYTGTEGFGIKKEQAKRFWDSYVKGDKQFTTCELDDKLIGILHKDDNIEMAFDHMDYPVNKSELKDCI